MSTENIQEQKDLFSLMYQKSRPYENFRAALKLFASEPQQYTEELEWVLIEMLAAGSLDNSQTIAKLLGRTLTTTELEKIISIQLEGYQSRDIWQVVILLPEAKRIRWFDGNNLNKLCAVGYAAICIKIANSLPDIDRVTCLEISLRCLADRERASHCELTEIKSIALSIGRILTDNDLKKIFINYLLENCFDLKEISALLSEPNRIEYIGIALEKQVSEGRLLSAQAIASLLDRRLTTEELEIIIDERLEFRGLEYQCEVYQLEDSDGRSEWIAELINLASAFPEPNRNNCMRKIVMAIVSKTLLNTWFEFPLSLFENALHHLPATDQMEILESILKTVIARGSSSRSKYVSELIKRDISPIENETLLRAQIQNGFREDAEKTAALLNKELSYEDLKHILKVQKANNSSDAEKTAKLLLLKISSE